ncbi:MAG: hypothetical protein IT338_14265 [Thermomicrobiales bacterium]|nr:hypothetical protein [Thermomicrobiales bacterium]
MILDLLEIWLAVAAAFAVGAFAGALLHDWLAGGRLAAGQAALADVVAMGVEGTRRGIVARRARRMERLSSPRGRPPPAGEDLAAPPPGELDRIAGLAPAMAARLAEAGYPRLDQLARWSDAERVWMADMLGIRRRQVGRWATRAQAILRAEQAARETPPPKEKPAKRERLVERPPREKRPANAIPQTPPLVARPPPLKPPAPKPAAAAENETLTPYEIALDLKLREP